MGTVYVASQRRKRHGCVRGISGHVRGGHACLVPEKCLQERGMIPGVPSNRHHWEAGIPAPGRRHGDEGDCLRARARVSPPLGWAHSMGAVLSPAALSH